MQDLYATGLSLEQQVLVGEILTSGRFVISEPKSGAQRSKEWRDRNAATNVTSRASHVTEIPPKKISNPPISPETLRVSTPRKVGTRLPADWHPSENLWSWGKTKLSLADETLKFETGAFRDHFWGVSGARGTKLDWEATWKNWMRESKRRERKRMPTVVPFVPSGPKRSWLEQRDEVLAKKGEST